jgi:hypothetical protein
VPRGPLLLFLVSPFSETGPFGRLNQRANCFLQRRRLAVLPAANLHRCKLGLDTPHLRDAGRLSFEHVDQ